MDGVDESDIPVAALNSVDRLSLLLLLFLLGVDFLSEDDGGVANSQVDLVPVAATSMHPPKHRSILCVLEWDNACRLASGIKALVIPPRTKSDTSETSMLSL